MSTRTVERRREPRVPVAIPIQLATHAPARPAQLKNVSRNGLCCMVADPVPEMTLLGIDLQLPGSKSMQVRGVVVRCAKLRGQSPPTYELGVYFSELGAEARAAIAAFVQAHPDLRARA
jgi:hypothetical protein